MDKPRVHCRFMSILEFFEFYAGLLNQPITLPHFNYFRPHKQYSFFLIPTCTQYFELILSRARSKFAESAFWKFAGV